MRTSARTVPAPRVGRDNEVRLNPARRHVRIPSVSAVGSTSWRPLLVMTTIAPLSGHRACSDALHGTRLRRALDK